MNISFKNGKKSILMFVHDGRLTTLRKKIEKPDLPAVVSYALRSWLLYILDNAGVNGIKQV